MINLFHNTPLKEQQGIATLIITTALLLITTLIILFRCQL